MNDRRRLIGVVKSDKMEQTVVVEISRTFRHPLYKKVVHTSKRVKAHDTLGCKIGDEVQIVESRPYSADTRFAVETIVKRRGEAAEIVVVDTVEIEPAPEPTEEPTEELIAEPTDELSDESSDELTDETTDESADESTDEPADESTDEPAEGAEQ